MNSNFNGNGNGLFGPGAAQTAQGAASVGVAAQVRAMIGNINGAPTGIQINGAMIQDGTVSASKLSRQEFGSVVMERYIALLKDTMTRMLSQCTEDQRNVFRRMYDHNFKFTNPVDALTFNQMDGAFQQLERTLKWRT